MNILIIGKSGTGKSNIADLLKNLIFKMDKDCTVNIEDDSRQQKVFGNRINKHNIIVKKMEDYYVVEDSYDIKIFMENNEFKKWFDKL